MDKQDKLCPRGADSDRGTSEDLTQRHARTRRRLLQSLTLGGAAVTVKALPERWTRPVASAVVLPAHAQATLYALVCEVGDFDGGGATVNPGPAFTGGSSAVIENLVGPNLIVDSVNFSAISATVSGPGCGQPTLLVQTDNEGISLAPVGGTPTDPPGQFNPLSVGISGTTGIDETVTADLTLTFSAAGAVDCVIDFTFTEDPSP